MDIHDWEEIFSNTHGQNLFKENAPQSLKDNSKKATQLNAGSKAITANQKQSQRAFKKPKDLQTQSRPTNDSLISSNYLELNVLKYLKTRLKKCPTG